MEIEYALLDDVEPFQRFAIRSREREQLEEVRDYKRDEKIMAVPVGSQPTT